MVLEFSEDFAFLGALIIKEVVEELLANGLDQAEVLILTGSRSGPHQRLPCSPLLVSSLTMTLLLLLFLSAGGIGVLVNVDHVAEQLRTLGHRAVRVRGLADSGWVLDRKNYTFGDCRDVLNCGPIDSVKKGVRWVERRTLGKGKR